MTIGVDIDDTICDSFETLLPLICSECDLNIDELRSKNINYEYFFKDQNSSLYKAATRILGENVYNIPIKKDVTDVLNTLHKMGYKIIFITARSTKSFSDPYLMTKKYLDDNDIYYDKLIVSTYDKENICKEEGIDLFIDDSIDHNRNISNIGIKTLLFDACYNRHCNDYKRVSSWEEVLDYITTSK